MKKITRTDELIVIELERGESAFLAGLPARLAGPAKPARFAKDAATNEDLRQLLEEDLKARRKERTDGLIALLAKVRDNRLELGADQAEQLLALMTDLRLMLADRIGIKDDGWERSLNLRKKLSPDVHLYVYLTTFQGQLLEHGFGVSQSDM